MYSKKEKLGDSPTPIVTWQNSYISENAVPYVFSYTTPTPSPIVVNSGQVIFLTGVLGTTNDSAQTEYVYVSFTSANDVMFKDVNIFLV